MVDSSSTLVLRSLVLCRSTIRGVLVIPLVVVLLGCPWVTPGAVVGIVVKFATLETAIGLNWISCIIILGRCVHCASLTILLLDTRPLTDLGVASLLVLILIVPLTLLSRALCLVVVVSTLVSGAELRTLGVVLPGVSAGLPLVLSFVVRQFFPFCFQGQLPCSAKSGSWGNCGSITDSSMAQSSLPRNVLGASRPCLLRLGRM
jgi:hypothetical protein